MYFVEILVWFFFPDFQCAMIAFNLETPVWYHTFDQYFRCISIVCKNYFYHSLFHTKKSSQARTNITFLSYMYIPKTWKCQTISLVQNRCFQYEKIFRTICKNSAISDVIFCQGANRYIYLILWQLFYKIRKQSNILKNQHFKSKIVLIL